MRTDSDPLHRGLGVAAAGEAVAGRVEDPLTGALGSLRARG
jgi:hypothetical protein